MASQENRCSSVAHATIVRGERVAPTYYNHFPKISSACLGAIQIVCSSGITVACIVCFGFLGGILLTLFLQFPLMALIAGSCGINAGVKKTTCKIVTNLVLSILASINSCTLTIVAIIVLTASETLAEYYNQTGQENFSENVKQMRGYFVALLILSLIETVAAITSAVIGCHFVCFCCKRCCCQFDVTTTDQVVMLHSDDEEQLLPGSVALPRNDCDVPMIAVDGATGLVQPYLPSNFGVSAPSYVAYPK